MWKKYPCGYDRPSITHTCIYSLTTNTHEFKISEEIFIIYFKIIAGHRLSENFSRKEKHWFSLSISVYKHESQRLFSIFDESASTYLNCKFSTHPRAPVTNMHAHIVINSNHNWLSYIINNKHTTLREDKHHIKLEN